MKKSTPEIFYGSLCGVALSLWTLVEFLLGFHTTSPEIGQYSGFISIIFPIVFIYVAMHARQTDLNAPIPFLDGINVGFRIAFFSALIFTIFLFIYISYINPDWIATTVEWQRRKLILGGATDDEIETFMEQNRQVNNSFAQTIMIFIGSTGIGVFITLIEIPVVKALFKK